MKLDKYERALKVTDIVAFSFVACFLGFVLAQAIIYNKVGQMAAIANDDAVFQFALKQIENTPKYIIPIFIAFIVVYSSVQIFINNACKKDSPVSVEK